MDFLHAIYAHICKTKGSNSILRLFKIVRIKIIASIEIQEYLRNEVAYFLILDQNKANYVYESNIIL